MERTSEEYTNIYLIFHQGDKQSTQSGDQYHEREIAAEVRGRGKKKKQTTQRTVDRDDS